MNVKLIAKSEICNEDLKQALSGTGGESLVMYCARVSNPTNQTSSNTKLINYCLTHGHVSIFEMANMVVEIETSRAIAAQILRHRSFQFQEFCLAGNSLVTTILPSNGLPNYIPIERLYKNQHKKQYKNLQLRVYDEEKKEFTTAKLKEVFKTGVKSCVKVTFEDGKTITCTKDHKFLTAEGFMALDKALGLEFYPNKIVQTKSNLLGTNGIPVHQSYQWLKQAKQESIELKQGIPYIAKKANVSYHTIRKWLKKHNLKFSKNEISSYTPVWNKNKFGYKVKPRTKEQREYMSKITPKGKYHHAYKGGGASYRKSIANCFNKYRLEIFKKYEHTCQLCFEKFNQKPGKIELHHIKEVSQFPELALQLNNVIPVHRICHMQHHGKNSNYKAWRSKSKGNTKTVKYQKVVSVEYAGEIETYDLEVDHPSHNYVANKICVHNSQRYAEAQDIELVEARAQDPKNRQNSLDNMKQEDKEWFREVQEKHNQEALRLYREALSRGVAKEQARFLLPLSTTTKLYMNGTLRSWIHYIQLRTGNGTQLEHQQIALAIKEIFAKEYPIIAEALGWQSQVKENV